MTLWYTAPGGGSQEVGRVGADAQGRVEVAFTSTGLAPGTYSMAAHGNWSGFTAAGSFSVE